MAGVIIRRGGARDLAAVTRVQAACPEAAQWRPEDYLAWDLTVAVCDDQVAGFAVSRSLAGAESEILNLAVDPPFRRRGIGRGLVEEISLRSPSPIYLEVRESNASARKFYEALGFQVVALRTKYYDAPVENGIVMKFHSC
jgi:[ribosomal protein S18]-alanine N-acetyltransferase